MKYTMSLAVALLLSSGPLELGAGRGWVVVSGHRVGARSFGIFDKAISKMEREENEKEEAREYLARQ